MKNGSSDFAKVLDRVGTDSYKWDLKTTTPSGEPVLPMWVADMDFAVSPAVTEALAKRIAHPVYGYTYVSDGYRDAFVRWQHERYGWEPDAGDLVYVPSVMPAVRTAILAFTDPGDEVILQTPVYYPFFSAIRDNGRVVLENPLRRSGRRYEMDLAHLETVISPRTRVLILCSPHNPAASGPAGNSLNSSSYAVGTRSLLSATRSTATSPVRVTLSSRSVRLPRARLSVSHRRRHSTLPVWQAGSRSSRMPVFADDSPMPSTILATRCRIR